MITFIEEKGKTEKRNLYEIPSDRKDHWTEGKQNETKNEKNTNDFRRVNSNSVN